MHLALNEELDVIRNNLDDITDDSKNCEEKWRGVFTRCFLKVDDEIGGKVEPLAPETVGSTAVVAVVCSSHIIVGNCGDSRAVLYRGKESIPLSVDHKVTRINLFWGGVRVMWSNSILSCLVAQSRR